MSPGDQLDAWLRSDPETLIAAFCAVCGGWTMCVTSKSDSARQWTQMCYVAGDLIMPIRSPASMGPACPSSWNTGERCEEE